MKKLIAIAASGLLLVSLVGCGNSNNAQPTADQTATTTQPASQAAAQPSSTTAAANTTSSANKS